jgi:hypothetical protein
MKIIHRHMKAAKILKLEMTKPLRWVSCDSSCSFYVTNSMEFWTVYVQGGVMGRMLYTMSKFFSKAGWEGGTTPECGRRFPQVPWELLFWEAVHLPQREKLILW